MADPATRGRFLTEYPAASRHLEATYKHLEMDGETHTANSQDPTNPLPEARCHYRTDGDKQRIDRKFSAASGRLANQTSSFVKDGSGSFIVDLGPSGSSYLLRGFGPRFHNLIALDAVFLPAWAAYGVGQDRVVDLLIKRGFTIEDAVSHHQNEQELVTVRWNWPWEGTGPATRKGEFVFLPGRNWALKSYHWRQQMPDKTWRNWESYADVTYGDDFEGVPLVKAVEQGGRMDDSSKVNTSTWEVTSLKPVTAKAEDFTLAAFNLKYEQGVSRPGYGWYLVVIGAVGMIASLIVRRWYNRRLLAPTA